MSAHFDADNLNNNQYIFKFIEVSVSLVCIQGLSEPDALWKNYTVA